MHFFHSKQRVKRAVRKYPDSDAHMFLTFSFTSAGLTAKPTIQLCDWTYDYYFRWFLNREPDRLEKHSVGREDSQIEGSDLVVSLFPDVAEYMKAHYDNQDIHYLGNAVNSVYPAPEPSAIADRSASRNILFIGGKHYVEGISSLLDAFSQLRQDHPDLRLDIVGMDEEDFPGLPDNAVCYGYLDKGRSDGRELYYRLLREARMIVNTTPNWGAFSSAVEAMYFFVPIITAPCRSFVETFGETIDFGYYCEDNSPEMRERCVTRILNDPAYEAMCLNAHEAVKDFDLDYVSRRTEMKVGFP